MATKVEAHITGTIFRIETEVGASVQPGDSLIIIESMKTEQIVKSPRDGVVQRVSVQEGDRVDRGMRLVVLAPVDGEG